MPFLVRFLLVAVAAALTGCSTLRERPPAPTLDEIRQMASQKVAAERIIERMRESGAVYRLKGSDFARLRDDGIPDAVLDFMSQRQEEAVRYEEWLSARDRFFRSPWGYRPFPPYPYGSPLWGPGHPFWR